MSQTVDEAKNKTLSPIKVGKRSERGGSRVLPETKVCRRYRREQRITKAL